MNAQAPPLSKAELCNIDAYWRAANYLSVGQIYLYDNPLLKKPLTLAHIKPRLLGHWGTTPGLNFVYVHLNRAIKAHDLSVIYIAGPGHGGPGMVANAYLEQTYSEAYPHVSQDEEGMKRLFTQFSFPGGIPSHVAPETPVRFTRAGNWATRCRTPSARRSTTPTSSSRASSAMAKRKPLPLRPAGIPTSSSIRSTTAPCCPSCISTSTRLRARPCWRAFRARNWRP
jgi:hypothetical protein